MAYISYYSLGVKATKPVSERFLDPMRKVRYFPFNFPPVRMNIRGGFRAAEGSGLRGGFWLMVDGGKGDPGVGQEVLLLAFRDDAD